MIRRPPRSTLFPTRRSSDLVHAFLYTPQWVTVANKNLRGLWKDMPIFENDLSALDRKSTRLNSSHSQISYAVFCLKKKKLSNSRIHLLQHVEGESDHRRSKV